MILAGDTLFAGSIGRTDLPGGDPEQMMRSLRDKLLTRDDGAVRAAGARPDDDDRAGAGVEPVPAGVRPSCPGAWAVTDLHGTDLQGTDSGAVQQRAASFAAPKGVPEYYPPVSRSTLVRDPVRRLLAAADRAGYGLIELPVFEDTALFVRGVGESTDMVGKEMYTFTDRGGRSVTLRPEGTAGVVRAVIEHGLDRGGLPVKLSYAGPFFRYERPQAGRYRQLQQVGIEAIGVDDPALDAEVIAVAADGYAAVGITGQRLDLTSLGDQNCRPAYRERLQPVSVRARHRRGQQARAVSIRCACWTRTSAPSCRRPAGGRAADDRPPVRRLWARAFHRGPKPGLDALGIDYTINGRMVRGLDYYTTRPSSCPPRTRVTVGHRRGRTLRRADGPLGGQPLTGIGFGLGVDRTLLAGRAEGVSSGPRALDVFGVPLGDAARRG